MTILFIHLYTQPVGFIWMSLEFTLLCFCVIAGIINLSCLIVTLVGLCGPEKRNGLVCYIHLNNGKLLFTVWLPKQVRMEVGNPSYDFKRRPSA